MCFVGEEPFFLKRFLPHTPSSKTFKKGLSDFFVWYATVLKVMKGELIFYRTPLRGS